MMYDSQRLFSNVHKKTKREIEREVALAEKHYLVCQTICIENRSGEFLGLLTGAVTPEYRIYHSKTENRWKKSIEHTCFIKIKKALKERVKIYKSTHPNTLSKFHSVGQRLVTRDFAIANGYIDE